MPDLVFTYDPTADEGDRLPPEVQAEIAVIAPSTLNDNAVSTAKLQDLAVTNAKLALDAVRAANILSGEVTGPKLGPGAVSTSKIAAAAVTPTQCGTGVVTSTDDNGSAILMSIMPISAADYAALTTPSTSVLYLILE